MNTMLGNALSFKTFSFLKANDVKILLPDLQYKPYALACEGNHGEPEFDFDYGVSREALEMNREHGNLYRYYETKKGEEKVCPVLRLELDDEYSELLDTHTLIAAKNSKLRVVLDYHSQGKKSKFRNSVIRVLAKEKAEVELFLIQREDEHSLSLESIAVLTEKCAKVTVSQYQLGASKLYTNYHCELSGDASEGYVNSLYFGDQDEELDLVYNMIHRGKKTKSEMVINGALKDNAYKNFKANLEFIKGAEEAVGSEEEYVVLLDDTVHTLSIPLMLCHEDDVEGNHAASAGKIDADVMFYIMSRGFSQEEAEALIVESKFASSIDTLFDEELENEVWKNVRETIKEGR